jgi:uncharacterized membrane protein
MMSQNRVAAPIYSRPTRTNRINPKAELEIAGLHDKIDHLLHVRRERRVDIQQTQLDLLNEIAGPRTR